MLMILNSTYFIEINTIYRCKYKVPQITHTQTSTKYNTYIYTLPSLSVYTLSECIPIHSH